MTFSALFTRVRRRTILEKQPRPYCYSPELGEGVFSEMKPRDDRGVAQDIACDLADLALSILGAPRASDYALRSPSRVRSNPYAPP